MLKLTGSQHSALVTGHCLAGLSLRRFISAESLDHPKRNAWFRTQLFPSKTVFAIRLVLGKLIQIRLVDVPKTHEPSRKLTVFGVLLQ
jgi:hypothetical protein